MSGMDRMTELQPCPFCGGEADTMTPEADDMRAATVMCMGCYCTGKECETEAQAIAAWNRRASQAAPAPSDGTCAECGCAPTNAAGLCATCVGERAPAPSDGLRGLVVKPLEWEGKPSDCYMKAETILGHYRIYVQYSDEWTCDFEPSSGRPVNVRCWATTPDDCKAAAQADHDVRIRAALTPAPAQEGDRT